MHSSGVFFDARLKEPDQFPVSARSGSWNVRSKQDRVTPKLAALHFYQLSLPPPAPPESSYDRVAFKRGQNIFEGKAKCATCHVPPLFTEPGNNLHAPSDIGIDEFQADRSPTRAYRTTPLRGLWAHQKGGFYHDGRFPKLADVVDHYNDHFKLQLSDEEKKDLIQFLLGL
jgi:cytochrome c peroxidase